MKIGRQEQSCLRGHLFVVVFIFCVSVCQIGMASAASSRAFQKFQSSISSQVCKKRLESLERFHLLFDVPAFRAYVLKNKTLPFAEALVGWSTDLLVQMIVELEQNYEVLCPEHPRIQHIKSELKTAYLLSLGVKARILKAKSIDPLFRGLLVMKDEIPALRERLGIVKVVGTPTAKGILTSVFKQVGYIKGVVILGANERETKALRAVVDEVCKEFRTCPFWDKRLINKVVLTGQPGAAAFLPEVGALVFSRELLQLNKLHKFVLLHELTHVAIRGAWVFQRQDWVSEFAKFSNWQKDAKGNWKVAVKRMPASRPDDLSRLSEGSSFSILPDELYLGTRKNSKLKDGFVLSKTYEEALRQNDPSEDLADSVAAFFYMPQRYCFNGKNFAPNKFMWVARKLFPNHTPVICPLK